MKKGDTIRFELEYAGTFKDLQINSNLFRNPEIWVWDKISRRKQVRRLDTLAVKKQRYVAYERNGNVYEFEHFVANGAPYYLDILLDRRRVMRFKVVTGK